MLGGERVTGVEPASPAWKAGALPLSYTREFGWKVVGRTYSFFHHCPATHFQGGSCLVGERRRSIAAGSELMWNEAGVLLPVIEGTDQRAECGALGRRVRAGRAQLAQGRVDLVVEGCPGRLALRLQPGLGVVPGDLQVPDPGGPSGQGVQHPCGAVLPARGRGLAAVRLRRRRAARQQARRGMGPQLLRPNPFLPIR